jgi:crotonobetainyl-CoA:carnitine CoA-transferase CaiB-like acyl-CoA transferase
MSTGALSGVKVVDLSRVLAGPLCTQMLADHGADVVKVEPPTGDETRTLGPPFDASGNAAYYCALNRGKRGTSLDLSQPAAREVLLRMLEDADVLVENFLPGTMEKWELGYDTLSRRFPRLVYCTISGFGADGPLGGLPGYDAVLQALCGVMSVNGEPSAGPTRVGIPVVDHLTGYVALSGILLALNQRHATGRGQRVEATLYDTALSLLVPHAANWMASGKAPSLLGSAHPNIAPYDKFRARDGDVFIGILNDAQFRRFCRHLGREPLCADPRFASNAQRLANRDALRAEIEDALAEQPGGSLCEGLMRVGVPAARVQDVPEALTHPHTMHRGLVLREGTYAGLRSPMRLQDSGCTVARTPPAFAQDTEQVLEGLGYSREDRARLRQAGAAPPPRQ